MKVGFLSSEYPTVCPQHGGIGSMTQTLAHELVRHGHTAVVYAFSQDDGIASDGGVEVVTLRRGDAILLSILRMRTQIGNDLKTEKIDVVESPETESHCLPGGKGTIVRMNGSHHFWCRTLPQKRKHLRLLLEQIGIRSAYGLCAVSNYTAEITRSEMHLGKRPIEILYNPVNTETFQPRPETVVKGRIVFTGSVVEKKGVRELCQGMNHVIKQYPHAELYVAGRDCPAPDGSPSFRRAIEAPLDPETKQRIRFLGHLPISEISKLMASAEVCAFPSYMETQGIVIAEAMSCGRPVLVSNQGPGPEILGTDGECGWLVNPRDPMDIADKICRVLSESTKADSMGHKGRQRSEALFSVSACLSKSLDFYKKCARRR